jgi:hypothetical protein
MNIFLAFFQSNKAHPIPAYSFWPHYIKNGIAEAGHQWLECAEVDWALGLVPKSHAEQIQWLDESWNKTLSVLKRKPVHLFLSYLYPEQININAITEIKKMGIPCVNFFCDNVREFKKLPSAFEVFDLNWVPELKAVKLYRKAGYPYINLPMPIWVDPKLREQSGENIEQITFIGSHDIQRQLFFERVILKAPDLKLAIYGSGWDKTATLSTNQVITDYTFNKKLLNQYYFIKKNGVIPYLRKLNSYKTAAISPRLASKISGQVNFEDYCKLTAQSTVTLGVNRYPSFHFSINQPNTYSRLRDIEAPMLGACYLTEWTEGIEQLYDIENEINTYKNEDELITRINGLQNNAAKRKQLKINGQKRALQNHSIPQSISKIVSKLNL